MMFTLQPVVCQVNVWVTNFATGILGEVCLKKKIIEYTARHHGLGTLGEPRNRERERPGGESSE